MSESATPEHSEGEATQRNRLAVRDEVKPIVERLKPIHWLVTIGFGLAMVGAGAATWAGTLARAADLHKVMGHTEVQQRQLDVMQEHIRATDQRLGNIEVDVRTTRDGMLELLDIHRRPSNERGRR